MNCTIKSINSFAKNYSSFEGSYYCDLTTARATASVASSPLPTGVQTASVATDADADNDGEINSTEATDFPFGSIAADRLYQLTGSTSGVTITVTPRRFLPDRVTVIETPTAAFLDNDTIVTINSASPYPRYPIDDAHHLNVHSTDNAREIAQNAQAMGLVDWRAK